MVYIDAKVFAGKVLYPYAGTIDTRIAILCFEQVHSQPPTPPTARWLSKLWRTGFVTAYSG